jgi:electron transfer flavoprotein beta subunit
MLKIVVCLKQVLDPEAPTSAYKIDAENKHVLLKGVPPVLNPFDENALQAAIQIRAGSESRISVISLGTNLSRGLLRKTLAYGADELILVEDEAFTDLDSYSTAFWLAAAIRKIGEYDLILAGREAADTNAGVVGSGIAEILGINCLNIARKIALSDAKKLRVQRIITDGYEEVETSLPALVTVSNEVGELKPVTVQEIMAAQKKSIAVWKMEHLGAGLPSAMKSRLLNLFIPRREVKCELVPAITGDDGEKGSNLALKLREAGML